MPITIKELHIKINVDEKSGSKTQPPKANKTEIVASCVEEVMNILDRQKQR